MMRLLRRLKSACLVGLVLALVAGCARHPMLATGALPGGTATTLVGRVHFGGASSPFTTQATTSDIGNLATVSFLDNNTSRTVTTTVTDSTGNFSLNLAGFTPVLGTLYVVEAVKGLNTNAVGNDAARLRTLISYGANGWTSLTSSVANGPVVIDVGTTAIGTVMSLRGGSANPVATPSALIGTVTPGTPDTYSPPSGTIAQGTIVASEFASASTVVSQAITANRDPLETIYLDGLNWIYYFNNGGFPNIAGISPNTGPVGTPVKITGSQFNLTPGNNVVKYNGVLAAAPSPCTFNQLGTVVPPTWTGAVTLTVGNYIYAGPTFFVVPTAPSFAPTSGPTGTSVTITGTGFDPNPANDTVTLGGQACVVSAATNTQLTVTVPTSAQTGQFVITTAGGSVTTSGSFGVTGTILTMAPGRAPFTGNTYNAGAVITITGNGFTPRGTGGVWFYANGSAASVSATVNSWSQYSIQVQLPAGMSCIAPNRVVVTNNAGWSNAGLYGGGGGHNAIVGTTMFMPDYYWGGGFKIATTGGPFSDPARNNWFAQSTYYTQARGTFDGNGIWWEECSESGQPNIAEINQAGTTLATFRSNCPPLGHMEGIAVDGQNNVWFAHSTSAGGSGTVTKLAAGAAAGSTATVVCTIPNSDTRSAAFDAGGNLLLSDKRNYVLWKVNPTTGAYVQVMAGNAGNIAFDNAGHLLMSNGDGGNTIAEYNYDGNTATLVTSTFATEVAGYGNQGIMFDPAGANFFTVGGQIGPLTTGTFVTEVDTFAAAGGAGTAWVKFDQSAGGVPASPYNYIDFVW